MVLQAPDHDLAQLLVIGQDVAICNRSLEGGAELGEIFGPALRIKPRERALIERYEHNIDKALSVLAQSREAAHHDAAVALASLPEQIRGYGHVRARSIAPTLERERELLESLQRRVIVLRQAA